METQLPVANRNNNPGNIKDPSTGQFKIFNTPQEGYAALMNDLEVKKTGRSQSGLRPDSTLADFAKVYAPSSDNNNSAQYTANLANHMGVRPDARLNELDTAKWAEAIAHSEGYQGQYSAKNNNSNSNVSTPNKETPEQIQQEKTSLEAQGKPVSVREDRAEPTMGGQIIRGLLNLPARLVATAKGGVDALTGKDYQTPIHSKYLGDVYGFGMKPGQTGTERLKDVGGGLLEAASYAVGGPEIGAGLKALSLGEHALPGLLRTGISAGKAGAIQGAGTAMQENKDLAGIGSSALTGGIGAGLLGVGGGALAKGGGKLFEYLVPKVGPEKAAFVHNKVVDDIFNTLSTTEKGSHIDDASGDIIRSALDRGFYPEIKENGRMDFTKSSQNVRNEIQQGQQQAQNRLDNLKVSVSLDEMKQKAIQEAEQFHGKDKVNKKEIKENVEKIFNNIEVKDPNKLSAEDIYDIRNSLGKAGKWEQKLGASKKDTIHGSAAKSSYASMNKFLYEKDPELGKINEDLSILHRIEKIMGPKGLQNKVLKEADTRTLLQKLAGGALEKFVGRQGGEALSGVLGQVTSQPKSVLTTKIGQKTGQQLRQGMKLPTGKVNKTKANVTKIGILGGSNVISNKAMGIQ